MRDPNIRSVNTYWKMNWEPIKDQVKTFVDEVEIMNGLKLIHTGGHSEGHSILLFEDGEECFIHMADLMPTHGHQHKLRSEEHTSELQSRGHLVCRLLLEKKNQK